VEFLDLALKRYSVRSFLDTPVEENKIRYILEAACSAPSACNNQPWIFIVIRDKDSRFSLSSTYDRPWFLKAPVIIAACCDRTVSWKRSDGKEFGDIDTAIALDHLTLAAAEHGLGTCWIGAFNEQEARRALDLPSKIDPIAFTPLGYPSSEISPKKRKSIDEVTHWDYFGGKRA
jgi:nitroreductase